MSKPDLDAIKEFCDYIAKLKVRLNTLTESDPVIANVLTDFRLRFVQVQDFCNVARARELKYLMGDPVKNRDRIDTLICTVIK